MHKELLVASIKANGKVLRELNDLVLLPFGTEYSIYIKNLSTQRVEFKISIDGKNICENGESFVLGGNQSTEIERFLGTDKNTGYKFKFIERTAAIENHRGIGSEDGLVQIEYEFERAVAQLTPAWQPHDPWIKFRGSDDYIAKDMLARDSDIYCSTKGTTADDNFLSRRISTMSAQYCSTSTAINGQPQFINQAAVNDAGITTQGSFSNQKFQTVAGINGNGVKHTMVFKLKGEIQSQPIQAPLTTKTKLECNMCGKLNKGFAKYCIECGTNLQLIA